ncbi:MAG: Transaldolase [Alphaproteobacteria bacterium MarineAlpha5_Bin11]|nr:MAG: Transaldolase [Alphaproteobacteria bacterium MarineAlpha5_Bin11]PPR51423.1 MAG: Transaldolase [Alphaproteobacteria bacterium MarineAlpha5_Bin10]|tara:strand:+ start:566 stop:1228 length:663 start_codon:yes stop_codon:yes gene_type:complete
MKFFLDTADLNEIESLIQTGFIDGITTNPSLIAKQGSSMQEIIKNICKMVHGPVSAEVTATDFSGMMKEGKYLASIAKNIAVKVPLTNNGLMACKELTSQGIMVNVTLCFSAGQAILAAKAGATFISPFIGRLDDLGEDGVKLIQDIVTIYNNYPNFKTQVLVASVRNIEHIIRTAKIGADIATLPPKIIKELYNHSLTEKGLNAFLEDWKKTGQKILPD